MYIYKAGPSKSLESIYQDTSGHIPEDSSNVSKGTFLLKGPAADATDAPQPWRLIVQPYDEDDDDDNEVFSVFQF
jgi:hypothetical protein